MCTEESKGISSPIIMAAYHNDIFGIPPFTTSPLSKSLKVGTCIHCTPHDSVVLWYQALKTHMADHQFKQRTLKFSDPLFPTVSQWACVLTYYTLHGSVAVLWSQTLKPTRLIISSKQWAIQIPPPPKYPPPSLLVVSSCSYQTLMEPPQAIPHHNITKKNVCSSLGNRCWYSITTPSAGPTSKP